MNITVICPQHGGEFKPGCPRCAVAVAATAMNGALFQSGERLEVVKEGPGTAAARPDP